MAEIEFVKGKGQPMGVLDYDENYLLPVIYDAPPLHSVLLLTTSTPAEATKVASAGKDYCYFKLLFSTSSGSASIRFNGYDINDNKLILGSQNVTCLGIEDPNHSGYYMSKLIKLQSKGWKQIGLEIVSIPTGSVQVFGG